MYTCKDVNLDRNQLVGLVWTSNPVAFLTATPANSHVSTSSSFVGYSPDLTHFDSLVERYYSMKVSTAPNLTVWTRLPTSEEFLSYCNCALRAYSHLSYNDTFATYGFRTDSQAKIRSTIGNMFVPVYILDMIREVCRPMYAGEFVSLLAYFPPTCDGVGLVPGIGYRNYYMNISEILSKLEICDMTPIVAECCGTSPICISTDAAYLYSNGATCPPFRTEAINALRFLRPQPTIYLGYRDINHVVGFGEAWTGRQFSALDLPTQLAPADVTYVFNPDKLIYGADGNAVTYERFVRWELETILLAQGADGAIPTPNNHGVQFHYGRLGVREVHSLIYNLCPTEDDMATPAIARARVCFGTTFAYKCEAFWNIASKHFPSDACPSRAPMESGGSQVPGKPKRKPK